MTDDGAEIRRTVLARDALRRESHLPPLDIEKEVEKARKIASDKAGSEHYEAQCLKYADVRQRIRNEIIADMKAGGNATFPNGWAGNYYLHTIIEKRFADFLSTTLTDRKS